MELFYILLVLLVVTRAFGELAIRAGQPALVGELIGGVTLGAIVHAWSDWFPMLSTIGDEPVFRAVTDLGMFFLMLLGGVELRYRDLAQGSWSSLLVALGGMFAPLGVGIALALAFLPESDVKFVQALLVGTALAVTAVPVTIRVLMDLGKLQTPAGRTIVSAAIVDDVLSLMLLAILTGLIRAGQVPAPWELARLLLQVLAFFAITLVIGKFVFPKVGPLVSSFQAAEFEFSALLVAGLAFAVLAEWLGLHFILGAFIAGLFFGRDTAGTKTYVEVQRKVTAVTSGFLAPIFFASIGLHLDLTAVTQAPVFLLLLIMAAFLSKIVGASIPAWVTGMSLQDAVAVGVGMSGRGAVELIIVGVAARAGLFSQPEPTPAIVRSLFSAIALVAILTTLATPPLLAVIYGRSDDVPTEKS